MKRFVIAFIAAFIFIFFWGWLYNGVLLKDVLAQAQSLFRPREEMMGLFHWIAIGEAGLALSFVMITLAVSPVAGSRPGFASESCWRFWRSARVARFTRRNPFPQSFSCW